MPEERTYQRQVGPGSTPTLPSAGADAFGAGVGRAAAQMGETLQQGALRDYKIERQQQADSQAADFNARFARARLEADKASIDARNNAGPGGAGHAEAMAKFWEAQSEGLLGGITDDRVRRQAEGQLTEFGTRLAASEYQFQEGQRIGKLVTDTQSAADLAANRAAMMHDPKAFAEEFSLGRQAIEAMPGVPADVKDKLIKYHDETVAVGYLNGIVRTNPAAVAPLIDSGEFNDILSPAQIERLRDGAEIEVRRQKAQAASQAALLKSQKREEIATVTAQLSAGIEVPDATLAAAAAGAEAIGDTSGAFKLNVARVQAGINKATLPWQPRQYEAEINRLTALGADRTDTQDVQLAQLRAIAPSRIREYNTNPGGWAAANGNPPPPLNLADPQSVRARISWARGVHDVTGRIVQPLTSAEAADFAGRAAASPKARIEVADQLAQLGGLAAVAAARQVAPDDPMMARLVLLQPMDRRAAVNGAEARKANPALIDGKAGNDAREAFLARVGPATAMMGQGDVNAAFDIARNLYADAAAKQGIQTFDEGRFNSFIHRALGGTKDAQGNYRGGIGAWQGNSVLLPSTMSQGQFETVLSKMTFRPENAPVFRNGAPMTPAQVRQYVPVQRPDGRFEFHGRGGVVLTGKDGTTWSMDIAAVAARYLK